MVSPHASAAATERVDGRHAPLFLQRSSHGRQTVFCPLSITFRRHRGYTVRQSLITGSAELKKFSAIFRYRDITSPRDYFALLKRSFVWICRKIKHLACAQYLLIYNFRALEIFSVIRMWKNKCLSWIKESQYLYKREKLLNYSLIFF